MGAPVVTPLGDPTLSGIRIDDGFASAIALSLDVNIALWETEVQLPGLDAGDPIDTTNMRNIKYRTKDARKLITLMETQHTCRYNAGSYIQLLAVLNQPQSITIWLPDGTAVNNGSNISFFGYISKADFKAFKEGEPPEVEITIVPTNTDPADGTEADPVIILAV